MYAAMLVFLLWCLAIFRADLARISPAAIWQARYAVLLAIVLSLLNYAVRSLRWAYFLRRLGYAMPLGFVTDTYLAGFAFTLSPGKVGELARARYYHAAGVPVSSVAAAFFVERLLDVLAMACLALLGLAALARYTSLLGATVAALLALLLLLLYAPWADWQRRAAAGTGQGRAGALLAGLLGTMVSARALLAPRVIASAFLLGLLAWALEGTGLLVLGQLAPAVALDWASATGIYAIAIIVGALSFLPGGLGSTEVVMAALLGLHGYAPGEAILLTLVCRVVTLWLAIAIGWGAVFRLRRHHSPLLKETP